MGDPGLKAACGVNSAGIHVEGGSSRYLGRHIFVRQEVSHISPVQEFNKAKGWVYNNVASGQQCGSCFGYMPPQVITTVPFDLMSKLFSKSTMILLPKG